MLETDHGEVVADSMRIVRWLEKRRPDPPLWPASPGRRAEVDVFVEWFNRVWKVPPNAMAAELAGRRARRAAPARPQRRAARLAAPVRGPARRPRLAHGRGLRRRRHLRLPVPQVRRARAAPRRHRPVPPGARRAPADRRAPSPRSRPGSTASTPSRALEVILRSPLGRVEKACRYCLGERTSQVHLLPEADERPAQAGRSLYQDRRTARQRAARRLRAGGPTQIHLCWPEPPSHERGEPVGRLPRRRRQGLSTQARRRTCALLPTSRRGGRPPSRCGARGSGPPRCGSRAPTPRGSSSRWR